MNRSLNESEVVDRRYFAESEPTAQDLTESRVKLICLATGPIILKRKVLCVDYLVIFSDTADYETVLQRKREQFSLCIFLSTIPNISRALPSPAVSSSFRVAPLFSCWLTCRLFLVFERNTKIQYHLRSLVYFRPSPYCLDRTFASSY